MHASFAAGKTASGVVDRRRHGGPSALLGCRNNGLRLSLHYDANAADPQALNCTA